MKQLTFDQKEIIFDLTSIILEKSIGDNDGRAINRIEKNLTRFIMREWNRRATKLVNNVVSKINLRSNKKVTKSETKSMIAALDKPFTTFDTAVQKRIKRDVKTAYRIERKQFVRRFKTKEKSLYYLDIKITSIVRKQDEGEITPELSSSFTETDTSTLKELNRLHVIAVGAYFFKNIKPTLINIIQKRVFEKGLSKKEAGVVLRNQISKRIGGFQQLVPRSILLNGQKSITSYFEGLSATTITRARAFSNLNLMVGARITQLRWSSIVDNRTSTICLQMDGRVFPIELAQSQMQDILKQKNSQDIVENFKWRKDLSEFNLSRGQKLNSNDAANLLARNGVPIVPPAHFRCRSEIVPV